MGALLGEQKTCDYNKWQRVISDPRKNMLLEIQNANLLNVDERRASFSENGKDEEDQNSIEIKFLGNEHIIETGKQVKGEAIIAMTEFKPYEESE